MKHAGPVALARLADLLDAIRCERGLKERKPGVFYFRSRAFLHFHEDARGLFADIRAPGDADFVRIKVDDDDGVAALTARIRQVAGGRS